MSNEAPKMEIALVDDDGMPTTAYAQTRKQLLVSSGSKCTALATNERMGQRDKLHNPTDLIELAKTVESADSHTKAIAGGKLELISDQIRALQAQAQKVLEDARQDMELSHAKCNFKRRPGTTYHLYRKAVMGTDGTPGPNETFFSMLSPNEWGKKCPYSYIDSYRLEHDMSWTPVERIQERDNRRQFNPQLLGLTDAQVQQGTQQLRLTLL